MYNRGIVGVIIIFFGLLLSLVAIGFFRTNNNISFAGTPLDFENIADLPCGLRLYEPKKDEHVKLPIRIFGYANGCGWENRGGTAGLVEVVAPNGLVLARGAIPVDPNDTKRPYRIDTYVPVTLPFNINHGTIIISNNDSGFYKKSIQIPVVFR